MNHGPEVIDKRHNTQAKIDFELVDREDVSGFAKLVYMVLARHEGRDRETWPGVGLIAKKAGIHHTTVEKSIKELESLQIIRVRRRNGAANRYVLLDKSIWKTTLSDRVVGDQTTPPRSVVKNTTTLLDRVVGDQTTPPCSVEVFKDFKHKHTLASGEAFVCFWTAYPSKGKKKKIDARAAWNKLQPNVGLVDVIMAALEAQKKTDMWRRGIGIPYAASWLRGQRWTDELGEETEKPPDSAAPSPLKITHRRRRLDGLWIRTEGGVDTVVEEKDVPEADRQREREREVRNKASRETFDLVRGIGRPIPGVQEYQRSDHD